MEIIKVDDRYKHIQVCDNCKSIVAIYPNDVINCPYDVISHDLNRRIHTACPVCIAHMVIYLDDTPCFFKQTMARNKGWKTNG